MAEPDGPDESEPPSPVSPDRDPLLDVLRTKPARSGRTGQRPFGSLGDQIEARVFNAVSQRALMQRASRSARWRSTTSSWLRRWRT